MLKISKESPFLKEDIVRTWLIFGQHKQKMDNYG